MRVGILGSGLMGWNLGTIFAHAAHEVVFSYARSNGKLKRLARDAQGHARAGTDRSGGGSNQSGSSSGPTVWWDAPESPPTLKLSVRSSFPLADDPGVDRFGQHYRVSRDRSGPILLVAIRPS